MTTERLQRGESLENLYAFSDRLHETAKRIGIACGDRPKGGRSG
jgi:hypothetical protein